jgi:PEP-CTERM motif
MTRFGKMMLRAGLATMAVGVSGSAQAAEYLFSFGGTVTGSSIFGGTLFGATGTDLNGRRFSATIIYNDATPGLIQDRGRSSTLIVGYGASNPTSGRLTINGVSYNSLSNGTGGGSFSLANNDGSPSRDAVFVRTVSDDISGTPATDYFGRGISFGGGLINTNTAMINSLNLSDLNGFAYNPADFATSHVNSGFFLEEVAFHNGVVTRNASASGSFLYDSFTVSLVGGPTAAVPEPASWTMMIAGFGLVGGAMRRRRGQTVKVGYAA